MHILIALAVVVAIVGPWPTLGWYLQRRARRAGHEAVREALATPRVQAAVLPPARAITAEERAEVRVAGWLALREARTAEVLNALEERIKRGLDELLERAFEVLEQDAIDRAWVLLGTGEHEAVSLTA